LPPVSLGVRALPDGRLGEVISVVARRRRWPLEQKLAGGGGVAAWRVGRLRPVSS
jgi:hypothetical protein